MWKESDLIGFTSMDVNPKFAKGVKEFAALHVKLLGREADGPYPLMNYMGTKVLFQAIQKGDSSEPEAVRKGALSIDIPSEGTETGGGVKFDPKTGQNQMGRYPRRSVAEPANGHGMAGKSGDCQDDLPSAHLGGEEERIKFRVSSFGFKVPGCRVEASGFGLAS